jgi:hypothetical protein
MAAMKPVPIIPITNPARAKTSRRRLCSMEVVGKLCEGLSSESPQPTQKLAWSSVSFPQYEQVRIKLSLFITQKFK